MKLDRDDLLTLAAAADWRGADVRCLVASLLLAPGGLTGLGPDDEDAIVAVIDRLTRVCDSKFPKVKA